MTGSRRKKPIQLPFPPELCALICEEVGTERKRDLLALCRVSQLFRDEAQRLIFRTVVVTQRQNSSPLESWCYAVTRRPQLAPRVYSLRLTLDHGLDLTSDLDKLARALPKCVNLKELSVGGRNWFSHESHQGWALSNKCTFRLDKFTNSYFKNKFLSQFWNTQSEIRLLSLPVFTGPFPCHSDQLPNLIGLEVANIQALPTGRPLERIQLLTQWNPAMTNLSALVQYSSTLTTLNLVEYHGSTAFSMHRILAQVAVTVPNLVHLGFAELRRQRTTYAPVKPEQPQGMPDAISVPILVRFQRLETFFCHLYNISHFIDVPARKAYSLDEPQDQEAFGRLTMAACGKLRRITVALDMRTPPEFKGDDLVCTLTRTGRDGDVHVEHGTRFDMDKVSMFWV
ncbi:hypothetical protein FB45DRAFT_955172 [Roridomyces roridus]|uniref:F-box domain-containing protein n=1 Tax=Roridomyces roridus TaxID=1738132 RepID=A0AAD7F8S5_9AGAR|nr:hypothetical protein FB45DRAFT_955172 [Roridomyces roridus]